MPSGRHNVISTGSPIIYISAVIGLHFYRTA